MSQIEVTDPNASNTRGTAGKILRVRGFATSDGNTALLGVVLTDATTGLPYDASGGGGGSSTPVGGAFTAMPAATTNGAPLSAGVSGVELSLPPGSSVTYTIASSQPGSAPSLVRTISNPSAATSYVSDQINLASGELVYVTAASGGAFYRTL